MTSTSQKGKNLQLLMNDSHIPLITNDTSKIAPNAPEAERSFLGSLLLDKDAIIKVGDIIEPSDFYHDHHRFIYEAITELFGQAQPIDMTTVATKLQAMEKLELIGGPEYLAELQNEVPVSTHVFQYAQLIKHRATLRKIIKAGQEITALGYDEQKTAEELLEGAEKRVFEISQTFIKDRFVSIKDILDSSFEKYSEIQENPELAHKNRIATDFSSLNNKLNGGFNPSDLIIVAARPSMGKTAFSLHMAMKAAIMEGKKVGIISLEMSKEQLVERMICSELNLDSWKLHNGKYSDSEFASFGNKLDPLWKASLFIDDSMGASIGELRAKARRLQMEQGLDMIVIDYLQLMSGGSGFGTQGNRVQEISEISRSLKGLARELHIPIIALSQLSRSVEARPDKRPILSDLRDSGSIEQDADVVMMLYRDDYYNEDTEAENQLEVNVIKHRNGAVGRVHLYFDRSKMEFKDLDQHQVAPY